MTVDVIEELRAELRDCLFSPAERKTLEAQLAKLIRNATSQPRPATHRPPISGFQPPEHSPGVALFARAGQTPRRLSRCLRRFASSSDRSCRCGPSCGLPLRRRTGLAARTAGRTASYCGLRRHDEDGQDPAEAEACSDCRVIWNLCPIGLLNRTRVIDSFS